MVHILYKKGMAGKSGLNKFCLNAVSQQWRGKENIMNTISIIILAVFKEEACFTV